MHHACVLTYIDPCQQSSVDDERILHTATLPKEVAWHVQVPPCFPCGGANAAQQHPAPWYLPSCFAACSKTRWRHRSAAYLLRTDCSEPENGGVTAHLANCTPKPRARIYLLSPCRAHPESLPGTRHMQLSSVLQCEDDALQMPSATTAVLCWSFCGPQWQQHSLSDCRSPCATQSQRCRPQVPLAATF